MAMLVRTHLGLAMTSLRRNRTRSFLTALGIGIGVASIILILSLYGSINSLISAQVDKIGADLIVVRPSSAKSGTDNIVSELTSSSLYQASTLTLADVETIAGVDNVVAAAPLAVSEASIAGKLALSSATVLATSYDLPKIINMPVKTGQFLNEKALKNAVVLGYSMAMRLFGTTDAITQTVHYQGEKFMVIGVLDELEDPVNFNNVDIDNSIIINASYAKELAGVLQIQQINAKVETTGVVEGTVGAIWYALVEAKGGEQNFSVLSGRAISHPAGSLFSIVTGMLTLIASISLVVGGIGITNIMLVSVAERTHEIGIRRAVGASGRNILIQFLFEAVILSLLGGVLGFALGYAVAFMVSLMTPLAPFMSWGIPGLSLGVSLVAGTVFGIYPAVKASRKYPIESLKYYG